MRRALLGKDAKAAAELLPRRFDYRPFREKRDHQDEYRRAV